MTLPEIEPILKWGALAHFLVGLLCLAALAFGATPILGVHPALKPLKFGISIGIFLLTLAILLPRLSVSPETRSALAWVLLSTMILEIVPISLQAVRGTTSHFNNAGALSSALWGIMGISIAVATVTMIAIAAIATFRPMLGVGGLPMEALVAWGCRAGLWFFPLAAVSGFSMAARLRHSIGGPDGGPGLFLVNWSLTHGDLRVSHFFALHAIQLLPLAALLLTRMPIADGSRWVAFGIVLVIQAVVTLGTLAQALAGRPFW